MSDFWIPKYKYELVEALAHFYPKDKAELQRKSKKQLYAIYFKARRAGFTRAIMEEPSHGATQG